MFEVLVTAFVGVIITDGLGYGLSCEEGSEIGESGDGDVLYVVFEHHDVA